VGRRDADVSDPFDLAEGDPIARDRWGRPIIWRPWEEDGPCAEVKHCPVTRAHGHYARASTFNGWLDDGMGLATWKARHAALAVARASASTRANLAASWYPTKARPCPDLDEWIDVALTEARRDEEDIENGVPRAQAAAWGTAVHRFTEPFSPPHAPERIASDIAAYHAEIARRDWRLLETELFVVHDGLRVAGTLDHLYETPSGSVIAVDKKTGKIHPLAHTIQLVAYAHGLRYDPATGERADLHPKVSREVAAIAHLPLGKGRCEMLPVDLVAGETRAFQARAAYEARRTQAALLLPVDTLDAI
jgi:hypothetical protein